MKFKEYVCLYFYHWRDSRNVIKKLNELRQVDLSKRSSLKEVQLKKLNELLRHARTDTSFWNKSLKNLPETVTQSEFETIPILNKSIIRDNRSDMCSNSIKKFHEASTGGTTGIPLRIKRDFNCDTINKAIFWRARMEWGVLPSTKLVMLFSFGKGSLLGKMRMRLSRNAIGNAFPSSLAEAKVSADLISSYRPKVVEGFTTGILSTLEATRSLKKLSVPIIISTGEMMYQHQREEIEKGFSGKVFTYYGSNEIGSIAYECQHQKLHVQEDHVIVETINDQGEPVMNEPGKVIVTDLDNYAMPFIRYDLGDVAVLSDKPCSCGNPSMIIEKLYGRSQDYLSSESGKKLQATQLAGYLRNLTEVGKIQFIQTSKNEIVVLYEGTGKGVQNELNIIKQHLIERLGDELSLDFQFTQKIEKTKRGKRPLILRKQDN